MAIKVPPCRDLGIAHGADHNVNPAALAGKGRQAGRDHDGSNVFGFKLTVAGVDAKLVKHADQAFFGKIDGFYVVTGAV